jgi:hypothetical protein
MQRQIGFTAKVSCTIRSVGLDIHLFPSDSLVFTATDEVHGPVLFRLTGEDAWMTLVWFDGLTEKFPGYLHQYFTPLQSPWYDWRNSPE